MRVISLHQPWASAIALGHKRVETRHWTTRYRGEIAIHAAKTIDKDFAQAERALGRLPAQIPLGAIVAVAQLVDVRDAGELEMDVSAIERLYGNFAPGRYGWMLSGIQTLREPVGAIGRQGFWSIDGDLLAAVRVQL